MSSKKDYNIFSGSMFVESMRSSGYKDTSYAVAELVDNAIDAKATHIYILCQEKLDLPTKRYRLERIAVLDNGNGMNTEELRSSLLFGDGTKGGSKRDIGKFGMGLPNSSLSQCRRVDVYSWQNSGTPICSHLDYDEVRGGSRDIPIPESRKIPPMWREAAKKLPQKSGTLVVWSRLDRCSWTTSKTIIKHSQFLIGRIYRKFLHKKNLKIDMITLKLDNQERISDSSCELMLPNDPLYLMAPSSTPGKWGKEPMFKQDTIPTEKYKISFEGEHHTITVRYSLEKDELRSPDKVHGDQGGTKHGKHAVKNMGVSIIRADREITLDQNLLLSSEPRDRWWGVEIDIPTSLDSVVGLTNNKQHMDMLSSIILTVGRFAEDDSEEREMIEEFSERDETRKQLLDMVKDINRRIRSMRQRIKTTRAGSKQSRAGNKQGLGAKVDAGVRQEEQEGKKGQSDQDRSTMKKKERIKLISGSLQDDGDEPNTANETARQWVEEDRKIVFQETELDGSNFFTVKNIGGILQVKINSRHRAYKNLLLLMDGEEYSDMSCESKLNLIHDGLRLLLVSWARFEDSIENDQRRKTVQNIRYDWGKVADTYLEQNEA